MKQQSFRDREVARMFGFSVSTLKRQVKRGEFPKSVSISKGRKAWLVLDLEEYSSRLRQGSISESKEHLPFDKTWRTQHEK